MQALSDDQQIERLEKKVGTMETNLRTEITTVRSESRADFHTLLGVLLAMYATMIFGFAGILAAVLLQHP